MDLRQVFESINLNEIQNHYATGKEENLHLDFKLADGNFGSDDKKNFAKALSGLSNSDGGIIIWGIDARKNADGVDCSNGIKLIKPLLKALTRLNSLTGELVTPLVDGVLHKVIEFEEDSGVIVTLIPSSDSGPHMAKGGEDRYYKRSGDSFYRMEHFDIEDMFGRRKKPILRLHTRLETGMSISSGMDEQAECKIILGLLNSGRGTAKSPYISFRINRPYEFSQYGLDDNRNVGLPRLITTSRSEQRCYGGNSSYVIHPGAIHEITYLAYIVNRQANSVPDLIIECEYCSEGSRMMAEKKIIKGIDIYQFLFPSNH